MNLIIRYVVLLLLTPTLIACSKPIENHQKTITNQSEMTIGQSCEKDSDCLLPFYYAIRSNCPFEAKCIDSGCSIVCVAPYKSLYDESNNQIQCQKDDDCDCQHFVAEKCICHEGMCMSVIQNYDDTNSGKLGESSLSATEDMQDCDKEDHCKITKYLEENVAWTTMMTGVDFCSYHLFNKKIEDGYLYLYISCREYYPQKYSVECDTNTQEVICENSFIDKNICDSSCKFTKLEKLKLKVASGVNQPLILNLENNEITSHWEATPGSPYVADLKKHFPEEYFNQLFGEAKNLIVKELQADNLERAEEYFYR